MKRTITVLGVSAVGLALAAPSIAQFDDSDLRQLAIDGNRAGLAENAVPRFADRKIQVLTNEGRGALLDRGGIIDEGNVDSLWTDRVVAS